ncbi:MAG: hypothetical protein AAGH65_07565, partial [Pseudomonadota bacterium]
MKFLSIDPETLKHSIAELMAGDVVPAAISNQGMVYRVELGDQILAFKTVPRKRAMKALHLKALRNEHRAYQRLAGVPGFARCHGLIDQAWLVLDWVEGQPFRQANLVPDHPFFDQ